MFSIEYIDVASVFKEAVMAVDYIIMTTRLFENRIQFASDFSKSDCIILKR